MENGEKVRGRLDIQAALLKCVLNMPLAKERERARERERESE